jgi:hypothetical protein
LELGDFAKLRRINRVIEEHRVIRKHVKLVGDSVPDKEALNELRKTHADWPPGQADIPAGKLEKLQQTLSFLDEGLKNHFAFEGENLPPLCGDLLMRAILLEHEEIENKIAEARAMVTSFISEGLNEEEMASRGSQVQQMIGSVLSLIEEHAAREETVLKMMQKVLEENAEKK